MALQVLMKMRMKTQRKRRREQSRIKKQCLRRPSYHLYGHMVSQQVILLYTQRLVALQIC